MQQTASPIESYCSRLSPLSARTARSGLAACLRLLGMEEADLSRGITYGDSSRLVRALNESYGRRTVSKMLSFWRELIRECWRMGYMNRDEADRAMPKYGGGGDDLPVGRHLGETEIRALAAACGDGMAGSRNEALICLLAMGLRRGEVASLSCGDWNGRILRVRGKGRKVRDLSLPAESAEALDMWLVRRGALKPDDPLLCSVRGESGSERRLSHSGIRAILNGLVRKAGLGRVTPHDFRRTFAGAVLDSGADIGIAMRLMGHTNPSTTLRYDRRPAEAAWNASQRLPSPVGGRRQGTPLPDNNIAGEGSTVA